MKFLDEHSTAEQLMELMDRTPEATQVCLWACVDGERGGLVIRRDISHTLARRWRVGYGTSRMTSLCGCRNGKLRSLNSNNTLMQCSEHCAHKCSHSSHGAVEHTRVGSNTKHSHHASV
jgi:hypothetical protein